jgi:NTP pyrophosphatase (non-canonical NTP hydrolase)
MRHISLSQGKVAIVDDDDYEYLSKYKWYFANDYAKRNVRLPNGKRSTQFMHRVILNTPKDKVTDHINGNKLDNRKSNLRVCDCSENQMNVSNVRPGTSKYKGVNKQNSNRHKKPKWIARIQVRERRISLGYFNTEKEAAIAYNRAAILYHGDFANLNEVNDEMDFTQYQLESKRTIPQNKWVNTIVSNFCMGLAGETGEVVDYLKKVYHHDHELDKDVIVKEMGDVLWYLSGLATILGINLEDIAVENIEKLKKRYPEGFSTERSVNRDD